MKQIGLKAYRFSTSWPRILPRGRGKVNQKGIDFYSKLVDGLLEADILPFITLYHWDLPQALQDEGGWEVRSTTEAFVQYTEALSKALGDRVKNWITHNEPAVVTWVGNDTGEHAPGFKDLARAVPVSHHLLLSHGWAVPVLRQNSPDSEVGITLNVGWRVPASNSVADLNAVREADGKWTRWFSDPLYGRGYPADVVADFERQDAMPNTMSFIQNGDMKAISVPLDFLGVNYYNREVLRSGASDNEPQAVFSKTKTPENWTEMGWENYPEGLTGVLSRLYFDYKPLKMYENEALPILKTTTSILVAGKGADNIGMQSGGWTLEWQGVSGNSTTGTTILDGIKRMAGSTTQVKYDSFGKFDEDAELGIVVVGEEPYAEGVGDVQGLQLSEPDINAIKNTKTHVRKLIVVILSGRPLVITDQLDLADAWVAAWLPGTEGSGIADVLFGDHPFTGKLSYSWPRSNEQLPININNSAGKTGCDAPLFPFGFGLSYGEATPTISDCP